MRVINCLIMSSLANMRYFLVYVCQNWHQNFYTMCRTMKTKTMWNSTHFPAAMRSLTATTRAHAIDIANELMKQGTISRQEAISISIAQARRQARQLPVITPLPNYATMAH